MNKFQTIIFASAEGRGGPPSTTAGPYKIATELRDAGISCQIIHHLHIFSYSELGIILDKLMDNQTILIGFSTVFWSHFPNKEQNDLKNKTNYIVNYVLSRYPNCKIIGGGGSAGLLVNFKFQKLDALFEGYPEEILIEYIQNLKNKTPIPLPDDTILGLNNSVTNIYKQRNNTNLNFQNSKIIYAPEDYVRSNDTAVIEIGRGCIFKCKFCAFPMNGKTKGEWIKHADVLKEELIYNYTQFGTTHYIFADDTYNDSIDKIKFLLENVYSQLPFAVKFSAYLRLDLLMRFPESVEILRDSGLISASFGIETNNLESSKAIGKGVAFERQIEFLQKIKQGPFKDITIQSGFIVGLPHDTHDSINDLKEFLRSDKNPLDAWSVAPLGINATLTGVHKNYYSEFDLEYDKYNYIIDESDMSNIFTVNWSLPNQLTYKSCVKEAAEFNDISREHRRYKYGAFAYHRYCYVIDNANDIMTMSRKDLLKKYNLGKLVSNVNKEYYRRLLSI
jgi:radical SAM superfamily enzyme